MGMGWAKTVSLIKWAGIAILVLITLAGLEIAWIYIMGSI